MGPLLATIASSAFGAGPWVVDGTSLETTRRADAVHELLRCPPRTGAEARWRGGALRTLGVAVVAYSKKQGVNTWGHASLRVIYCLDDVLFDAEFEVYQLARWNLDQLRSEHATEDFVDSPWLPEQRGKLTLFRNARPADTGWYAENQADNREIYEVWLDLSQPESDHVTMSVEGRHAEQLARLRAHVDLTRPYRAWRDNCTDVFHALPGSVTEATGFPLTPFAWLRRLEAADLVRARVLYPSHHLVKSWDGALPATSSRRHPIVRRRSRLPEPIADRVTRRWRGAVPAVVDVLGEPGRRWAQRPVATDRSRHD